MNIIFRKVRLLILNILYFSALDENDESKIGIKNKILGQCNGLEQLGHSVWLARFRSKKLAVTKAEDFVFEYYLGDGYSRRRCAKAFHILKKFTKEWKIDLLYMRLPSMSIATYQFLHGLHIQNIKVLIELYTYPLNKERIVTSLYQIREKQFYSGTKAILSLMLDNLYYPFLRTVVDRLVVLLPKKKLWGIKTIQIQNGINTSAIYPRAINTDKDKITLLGVAYLSYWHGYDRVLKGLKAYYEEGGTPKKRVEFIIVGDGSSRKELENYVMENHLESYVSFVGIKSGLELDSYYDRADVGVAALGVHRKKLQVVSTLKSREYFAKGLPFLDSAVDYGINESVSRYYLKFPNDDTDVSIHKVITFAEQFKYTDEAQTAMRDYAVKYLDWKYQMSMVIKGAANVN